MKFRSFRTLIRLFNKSLILSTKFVELKSLKQNRIKTSCSTILTICLQELLLFF